jgi:transposase
VTFLLTRFTHTTSARLARALLKAAAPSLAERCACHGGLALLRTRSLEASLRFPHRFLSTVALPEMVRRAAGKDGLGFKPEPHKEQLMDSVPGVGPTLRASVLAWLPELGQLNRGEAAKLVGIAPLADDSGKVRGYRRIAGGRGPLRKVLFMATMGAMRHNSHLRAYYDRLRARGKLHKIALVATMRKLLLILNAIIKTDTPWSESCLINL